MPWAQKRWGRS